MSTSTGTGSPASLIAEARAGSPDALSALYLEHGAALFRLAYRLVRTREDAEDVVHDVFVGLPEALLRYEERGSFAAWLKRVTARVALMKLRRGKRRRVGLVGPDPSKTGFVPVDLRVVGSGRIEVPAGRFECWKVELPDSPESTLILWVSKDHGWLVKTEQQGWDWRAESALVSATPPTP